MVLCQKVTDIYIFFMLSVFPLFTGFEGYASITDSKFYCFAAATLLWLAALFICAIVARIKAEDLPRSTPVSICTYVFIALCCLSALCSPFPEKTLLGAGRWDGLVSFLLYLAIFLGIRAFGRLRTAHLYALGAAVTLCTLIAVLQLLGFDPLWLFPGDLTYFDAHVRYSGEFLGTIGNVDLLAGFLCLSIPLLAAVYVTSGSRPILLIPAAAGTFLLIVSGVAGGYVAILACVLICAPVLLRSRERIIRACLATAALLFAAFWAFVLDFTASGVRFSPGAAAVGTLVFCALCLLCGGILHLRRNCAEHSPTQYTRATLFAIAAIVLTGIVTLYFWPGRSGTMYEISRILHGEVQDSFGSSRIRIWRETLSLVPQRPLLGGGPGTVAARLHIEFSRYVAETGKTLRSFVDNAHNNYLTLLADIGIPGLLAYLGMMLLSFVNWVRSADSNSGGLPVGCAVICYWVQDFFGLGLCLVAPMFWLMWGLLTAKMSEFQDAPTESSAPEGSE